MGKASIAIALIWALTSAALAAEDMTSTELRTLDARHADRKAREDLLSILKPMKQYPRGMRRMVGEVWFDTAAYGTDMSGVCSRDVLRLSYAPTTTLGRARAEDTPVRPIGVKAFTLFYFAREPAADALEARGEGTYERNIWRSECTKLGEDSPGWFNAESPELAVRGYLLLLAAQAAVNDGSVKPAKCNIPRGEPQDCAAIIAKAAETQNLREIEELACDKEKVCFRIDSFGLWTTIEAAAKDDSQAIEPQDIKSVDVEEYIIVT